MMESPEMSLNNYAILNSPGTSLTHFRPHKPGTHWHEEEASRRGIGMCIHPTSMSICTICIKKGEENLQVWLIPAGGLMIPRWCNSGTYSIGPTVKHLNYQHPNFTTSCNSYCVHCKEVRQESYAISWLWSARETRWTWKIRLIL